MSEIVEFIQKQFIILVAITLNKRIPVHFCSNEIIRIALSHARSNSMNPAEENIVLFLKQFYPEVWKSIVELRSFKIQSGSDKAAVSTEYCLPLDVFGGEVINDIRRNLLYYFNNIYYFDVALFDNMPSPVNKVEGDMISDIDVFSEQRLRSIGGTQTRYPHRVILGQESFVGQRFNDKPAHTTGRENLVVVGEIVDFHALSGKSYISILTTVNGKKEKSEKLEYIIEQFDDLIRLAIKQRSTVRVVAEEKIDHRCNLYWGIKELSIQ